MKTRRAEARVLLVGAGGLGCPAALVMARAGIGVLGIAEDDVVDRTNLHRQILYREADVGSPKVAAAGRALAEIAPGMRVVQHATRLLPHNAMELVPSYDLVIEGSDNFATKFLAADACALARVPVIHAAAVRWHGTVLAVGASGAPCYRCLFEDLPREDAPNCAEAGVIGPLVGVIGAIQAGLALAMIDGDAVAGTLVTYDGKSDALRTRVIAARVDCTLCGAPSRGATSRVDRVDRIDRIEPSRYAPPAECHE